MHVLRWYAKYTHINILPDHVLLVNHNSERSMMMINPGLSIKIKNIYRMIYRIPLRPRPCTKTQNLEFSSRAMYVFLIFFSFEFSPALKPENFENFE